MYVKSVGLVRKLQVLVWASWFRCNLSCNLSRLNGTLSRPHFLAAFTWRAKVGSSPTFRIHRERKDGTVIVRNG